ncbi:hypothetical protein [Fusobacterium sp. PH5-44]|uniref:hypothetical protein n=1 Tax=unclassified Fusobacterium TaxID=2648384 RepID=UPI003D1EFAF4
MNLYIKVIIDRDLTIKREEISTGGVSGQAAVLRFYAFVAQDPVKLQQAGTMIATTNMAIKFTTGRDPIGETLGKQLYKHFPNVDHIETIMLFSTIYDLGAANAGKVRDAYKVMTTKPSSTKIDFYVTPTGETIPTKESEFLSGLNHFKNENGKYIGTHKGYPIRIRIEGSYKGDSNYIGSHDPLHFSKHIHIDYRKNINTGPWQKNIPCHMIFYINSEVKL